MTEAIQTPRLSPSIAKIMNERSPAHAWQAHRLLGGGTGKESTDAQDTGKIIEALVFNAPIDKFVVLEFDNYRTKAAQLAYEEASVAGLTAILAHKMAEHEVAAKIIRERIAEFGVEFKGGEPQKVVTWRDELLGVDCKGILDYYQDGVIHDLKTTTDASPKKMVRHFVDMGYDIQRAAYTEAIETTYPELVGRTRMIYWVAEMEPPYLVHPYEAAGDMRMLGEEKWHRAKQQWRECLENDYWPGYFSGIAQLSPTPWQMAELGVEIETKEIAK